MVLTKSFKDLVQRRIVGDAAFAENLLREGIDMMLAGDVDTGKAILRDTIKATVGFEKLGEATEKTGEERLHLTVFLENTTFSCLPDLNFLSL